MMGEPEDVAGECNAHLHIGDDYRDNHATMRCQLPSDHTGRHREIFFDGKATVEWDEDQKSEWCGPRGGE